MCSLRGPPRGILWERICWVRQKGSWILLWSRCYSLRVAAERPSENQQGFILGPKDEPGPFSYLDEPGCLQIHELKFLPLCRAAGTCSLRTCLHHAGPFGFSKSWGFLDSLRWEPQQRVPGFLQARMKYEVGGRRKTRSK